MFIMSHNTFSAKPGGYRVTEDLMWDANTGKYYLKGHKFNTASGHYERKMKWDSTTGAYNMPVNLTLAYDENNIKFHFVQSNAGSKDVVLYKYILEGNNTHGVMKLPIHRAMIISTCQMVIIHLKYRLCIIINGVSLLNSVLV